MPVNPVSLNYQNKNPEHPTHAAIVIVNLISQAAPLVTFMPPLWLSDVPVGPPPATFPDTKDVGLHIFVTWTVQIVDVAALISELN